MDATTLTILGWIARVLTVLVFVPMGINHFRRGPARAMAAMVPPRLRTTGLFRPQNLVAITGLCEIAGGLGILVPGVRIAAGLALAIFLVAVFPANAYAAAHREKFGRAAIPLVPRLLAQVALIGIVLVAGLL